MKAKIKYLIKTSLDKKIKTKWFKVVNILLLLLLVGIINLNSIIKSFGGDFDKINKIYVTGEETTYNLLKDYLTASMGSTGLQYEITHLTEDIEKAKETLEENPNDIIISITNDKGVIGGEIISYENIDAITSQLLVYTLNEAKNDIYLASSKVSDEIKEALATPISISRTFISEEIDEFSEARETLGAVVIPLFIVPFFMLIILLVQAVGADINEEKSTRGMEIIISSVPPKIHFFSKIIGATSFVLIQGALLFLYGGIGLLIKNLSGGTYSEGASQSITNILEVIKSYGVLDNIVPAIIIIVLLFLLSFIAYSLLAGILASMTTSIEDYQQLQTPLMVVLLIGYYLAIMASVMEGAVFIKVAAYIPFISAMLSPVLFLLGQASIVDLLISLVSLIVVVYLLFEYGLRIYKIGILNYSSKDLWKKIFKSLKEK